VSFTFGKFDTDSLGIIAVLRDLPSVDGLKLETLEAVGTDGRVLGGTTRSGSTFTFDTIIEGSTPDEAVAIRDRIALALDPARGEQVLTFDAVPGWQWAAVLSSSIAWERMTWQPGVGFKLRADITFDALSAFGRPVAPEVWQWTSEGSRTVKRGKGNARSYPTVEIEGTVSPSQTIRVVIGDVATEVTGVNLTPGSTLRLDYEAFDFGRWVGDRKTSSVVRSMSSLDRAYLWPEESTRFAVAVLGSSDTGGGLTRVALNANSRRQ